MTCREMHHRIHSGKRLLPSVCDDIFHHRPLGRSLEEQLSRGANRSTHDMTGSARCVTTQLAAHETAGASVIDSHEGQRAAAMRGCQPAPHFLR